MNRNGKLKYPFLSCKRNRGTPKFCFLAQKFVFSKIAIRLGNPKISNPLLKKPSRKKKGQGVESFSIVYFIRKSNFKKKSIEYF